MKISDLILNGPVEMKNLYTQENSTFFTSRLNDLMSKFDKEFGENN